jgi:hypothetical protein
LHWDGSSTPTVLTERFDQVVELAPAIEPILSDMDTMWRVLVCDFELGVDGESRRHMITAVGKG